MSGAAARTGKERYKEYKNIEDYKRNRDYVKRKTQHEIQRQRSIIDEEIGKEFHRRRIVEILLIYEQ